MKRIRLGIAGTGMLVLVLGAVVFAGSSSHRRMNNTVAVREGAGGLVSASAGESDRNGTVRAARTTTSSFGPNVINGRLDGVSPPVSSLPVITALPVTSVTARHNEELQPAGQANAKDPVIQKQKGTGPISAPIQNFDGMCLPLSKPCGQASDCACLPPDTNGDIGTSQYVQIVNEAFVVYSKTGAVLRPAPAAAPRRA